MGISGGFLEADTCRIVSCAGRYHLTVGPLCATGPVWPKQSAQTKKEVLDNII